VNKTPAQLRGKVELRPDKRPRPLVVRSVAGSCLTVNFTNLLAPVANPNNPRQGADTLGNAEPNVNTANPACEDDPVPNDGICLTSNPDCDEPPQIGDTQCLDNGALVDAFVVIPDFLDGVENPFVGLGNNDQVAGRCAGFHASGTELVTNMGDDGSMVGKNPGRERRQLEWPRYHRSSVRPGPCRARWH
jgi:hypothetical protein